MTYPTSHFSPPPENCLTHTFDIQIDMGNGNFCDEAKRADRLQIATMKHKEATSSELHRDNGGQMEDFAVSKGCQNFLIEILVSEKFALLCDLLLGKLPGIKADSILDFNVINSRMKSRAYGLSIGLLHQDLQRVLTFLAPCLPSTGRLMDLHYAAHS